MQRVLLSVCHTLRFYSVSIDILGNNYLVYLAKLLPTTNLSTSCGFDNTTTSTVVLLRDLLGSIRLSSLVASLSDMLARMHYVSSYGTGAVCVRHNL